jgi:catechol 2,3-dioxygenase-like lactoylglutathione lyase family enzyme
VRAASRSLPCLAVPDVGPALEYYERHLGFRLVRSAGEPPSALVTRDGASVVLRRRGEADPPRADTIRHDPGFDVVLSVPDLDATFEDLSVQGNAVRSPPAPHPLLGRAFTVQDRYGHLIAFSQAPRTPLSVLRRHVREGVSGVRAARFNRAALAELDVERRRFAAFYEDLDDKRDIFYMFFTGGLVHWAAKAASYVPPSVNLVVIGSNLSAEERSWVTDHLRRPFHHIDLHVNDWPVWDFLLQTNRFGFGWLDIDCLVLEPGIFTELADVPAAASVNHLWSYDSGFGFRVANTYLLFVNVAAVAALRAAGIPVWGRPHDWHGGDRSAQAGKKCHYRVPGRLERRTLLRVVPPDDRGRPRPPGSHAFFDTMSVFQILARTRGFTARPVRDLRNPMLDGVAAGERPSLEPQGMSDELIHVGGISYYQEFFHDPAVRTRYLAADHLVLREWAQRMPDPYRHRLAAVEAELRGHGVEPDAAAAALRDYLGDVGGLSPASIAKAVGPHVAQGG